MFDIGNTCKLIHETSFCVFDKSFLNFFLPFDILILRTLF